MTDEIVIAKSSVTRKLDLACGQSCRDGFEGVDLWDGAKHQLDLLEFPWPFEDNSVAELHCSHFVEHIPMGYIDAYSTIWPSPATDGFGPRKDVLFAFFDECHRVLVPDGKMTVITPSARSNRAFQDPTHRRFIVGETYYYLNAAWRKIQKLDHYNVGCNFEVVDIQVTCDSALGLLHPQAHSRHIVNYWNTTIDYVATLKALKPSPKELA